MVFIWVVVLATTAVATFWNSIREWATTTLADAIGRILGDKFREAFLDLVVAVDEVVTRLRRAVRSVAEVLKQALLRAAVTILKRSRNEYVQHLCAYVQRALGGEKPRVFKVVHEEELAFEELPDDVRAAFIRGQQQVDATNVLQLELSDNHST